MFVDRLEFATVQSILSWLLMSSNEGSLIRKPEKLRKGGVIVKIKIPQQI